MKLEQFQDKLCYKNVHAKIESLDIKQQTIFGENSKLAHIERTCPVCNTKYPSQMAQGDFEAHVQGHFR